MPPEEQNHGVMKPLGGGDPIPLIKTEMTVGRRPSCDICLDYVNVSGKHCQLRLIHGVWHVRDLGSTNGTTVNGQPLSADHSLMPDDELGIADHLYHIEYEPSGPEAMVNTKGLIDSEVLEERKRTSLMELAGLDTDDNKPKQRRPQRAPQLIERLSADEADFDDALPDDFQGAPAPKPIGPTDDDFLKLIEEEAIKKPDE